MMMNEFHAPTTQISTSWIEKLALDEISMEKAGVVGLSSHHNPDKLLEESSIRLVDSLRDRAEVYVERFNELRSRDRSLGQIKIFKISGTVNDFMLFRNSLRLVIARKSHDLVSVGFIGTAGHIFSARTDTLSGQQSSAHEIRAHIGPFNKITWRHAGEEIEVDALLKFYLSEFIALSAR